MGLANKLPEFARAVANEAMREGGVGMITVYPKCTKLYEERSEEEAYSSDRSCLECWRREISVERVVVGYYNFDE